MSHRVPQIEQSTGVREWLNKHPGLALGLTAGVALAAILAIVVQVMASRKKYPEGLPSAYYSVDDGQSYFVAGMENVPPFQHDGKEAVRAHVFKCGNGKPFVGYLERYTPEAHKAVVEKRATPQHQISGRELKRPGANNAWVTTKDQKASIAIADVRCPDGGSPEPIEP
jgi:hypothetical protein